MGAARRIAAIVEYDGTDYSGWQAQTQAPSVQRAVEQALSAVAGHPLGVICAGRTDRGVHALGQVVHFDTVAARTPRAWVLGANTQLPPAIALQWADEVAANFHARHSAQLRVYRYRIVNGSMRSALRRQRSAWVQRPLDAARMQEAAQVLLGEHDFSAFRSIECQSVSTRRRIARIEVRREGDSVLVEIAANAFLHHMVRNIVGTLIEAQRGAAAVEAVQRILAARDRRLGGMAAPAAGRCLLRGADPAAVRLPAPPGAFW